MIRLGGVGSTDFEAARAATFEVTLGMFEVAIGKLLIDKLVIFG